MLEGSPVVFPFLLSDDEIKKVTLAQPIHSLSPKNIKIFNPRDKIINP